MQFSKLQVRNTVLLCTDSLQCSTEQCSTLRYSIVLGYNRRHKRGSCSKVTTVVVCYVPSCIAQVKLTVHDVADHRLAKELDARGELQRLVAEAIAME